MFTERIEIGSINDVDRAIEQVLRSDKEYFQIAINNLDPVVFRFEGGRFDEDYIPLEMLSVARYYKTGFEKYFTNLLKKRVSSDVLYFNVKRGSFEIDFQSIIEQAIDKAIGNMTGKETAIIIILAIGAWAASTAYQKYLESKEKISSDEVIKSAIDALKERSIMEESKNKPIKKTLEKLVDDEALKYGAGENIGEYTKMDAQKFDYNEAPPLTYETIKSVCVVKKTEDKKRHIYATLKCDALGTVEAVSKLEDNSSLYKSLDKGLKLHLKMTIGRDADGTIEEADIVEAGDFVKER